MVGIYCYILCIMENREELGLSPWRSATTSNEFWDRGLEENPQFPISVAPAIDEIVDGGIV
jgi:hypothetical protein